MKATRFLPLAALHCALLSACTGLPDVLTSPGGNSHDVPMPEDGERSRMGLSAALESYALPNGMSAKPAAAH